MSGVTIFLVAANAADIRLDRWFRSSYPGLSHGRLEKLLRTGQVRVDGGRIKGATRLAPGQMVRVPPLDQGADHRGPEGVSRGHRIYGLDGKGLYVARITLGRIVDALLA